MVISCRANGCSKHADGSAKRSFHHILKIKKYEGPQTMDLSESGLETSDSWRFLDQKRQESAPTTLYSGKLYIYIDIDIYL